MRVGDMSVVSLCDVSFARRGWEKGMRSNSCRECKELRDLGALNTVVVEFYFLGVARRGGSLVSQEETLSELGERVEMRIRK